KKRLQAREALDRTTANVLTDWLGEQPQLTADQKLFLEDALARYEEFIEEGGNTPEDLKEMARAYSRVGDIRSVLGLHPAARAAYTRSIELFEQLLREHSGDEAYVTGLAATLSNLAKLQRETGEREDALKSYDTVCALLKQLVPEHGRVSKHAATLAATHNNI